MKITESKQKDKKVDKGKEEKQMISPGGPTSN